MSAAILKRVQIGQDADPLKNFTLRQPQVPDGSLILSRGNQDNPGATILTVDQYGAILLPDGTPVGAQSMRNKWINGDMAIDQYRSGAAVLVGAVSEFICDRVRFSTSVASKLFVQQYADTAFAPYGFAFCSRIAVNTAFTHTAAQNTVADLKIEGYNFADAFWGGPYAKPVTVQFLIRTNKPGQYGVSFYNAAIDSNYNTTFTSVGAGNVEVVTLKIPGAVAGTWDKTNGTGLQMRLWFGAGTSYIGSVPNTWGVPYATITGNTDFCGTDGAYFHFTGLQVEVGAVATPFERRDYSDELRRCQRYYERIYVDYVRYSAAGAYSGETVRMVPKRIANAAVSQYQAFAGVNCTFTSAGVISDSEVTMRCTTTATGVLQATYRLEVKAEL